MGNRTMRSIDNILDRLERLEERLREAIKADCNPVTTVVDLQAEAGSCDRSASEPETTLADAEKLFDEAGFTLVWVEDQASAANVRHVAARILRDVMRANQPCPEPLMPAIEAELLARVRAKFPYLGLAKDLRGWFFTYDSGSQRAAYNFDTWDDLIDWLESECPAPGGSGTSAKDLPAGPSGGPSGQKETTMRIWKFVLQVTDSQAVEMPEGARVLSVDNQDGQLCLWAMVDQDSPGVPRRFAVVGTGNQLPENLGEFIGTVLIPPFVWHVFEEK